MQHAKNKLKLRRLGIHTQHEHVAYMREDCQVCISEGFQALTRIRLIFGKRSIVASINVVRSELIKHGQLGLSEGGIEALAAVEGDAIEITHLHSMPSLAYVRAKIYGKSLSEKEIYAIVHDIVNGGYSNVHLASFVTACAGNRMSTREIVSLTRAMIDNGAHIHWGQPLVVDKHCIGGLPGNRTTPIVVAIVSAYGLIMPKTSSRAITSPAGTADTMEVMAPVNLSLEKIKEVVAREGGCVVWGATAHLSPADDILIKVEKALDLDSEGQLIASILSKKVVAGATHAVIDMPVGESAKVRSMEVALQLKSEMEKVAEAIGLKIKVLLSDGQQPVGRGIGPALESRDILAVLRNEVQAPQDLKDRALLLAAEILELSGKVAVGLGNKVAEEILISGRAYEKFVAICLAQGGFREPLFSKYSQAIKAHRGGRVLRIDNRKLAKLAKLAGAPENKAAGIDFLSPIGREVRRGDVLYVLHAESQGELNYALEYYHAQKDILTIQ